MSRHRLTSRPDRPATPARSSRALIKKPLAVLIHLVVLGGAITMAGLDTPAHAQSAEQRKTYQVPAGALEDALNTFARQAAITLSFDPALVRGHQARALRGEYTVSSGLTTLLANSGIEAQRAPNGNYGLVLTATSGQHTTLPEVTVQAAVTEATEGSGLYTTSVVTIGKTRQNLKDIPQSVSVLTRQRIEDQDSIVLQDALANATGITLQSTNMAGTSIHSRGFEIADVQIDGQGTMHNVNVYANQDLAIYDRVEVLRGAAGLLQGAGQPGGAINLVRKKPLDTFGGSVALTAGSWNTYRGEADLTGPLNASGSLRGRIVAVEEKRGYFIQDTGQSKTLLYGVAELDLTSHTVARVGVHWQNTHEKPFYRGLPRYTDGSSLNLPRSTNLSADWSYRDVKNTTAFAELEHRLDNDWKMKLSAQYMTGRSDYEHTYVAGGITPGTGKGASVQSWAADNESRQKLLDLYAEGPFSLLGRTHHLMVGANYREHNYDYGSDSMWSNGVPAVDDIFNWGPGSIGKPGPKPLDIYTTQKTTQKGVFVSARFSVTEPLTVVLGGRLSWYESAILENWHGDPYPSNTKDSKVFTPYGAVVYALNPNWSAYASYADVFRTQSEIDITGKTLKPVVGANYEIGLKGVLLDGKVNTSFALFRIEETNRAQDDPNAPDPCPASPTGGVCSIADGKVRSEGFETEISGQITPSWMVAAGYTFNTTKYLRDNDGNENKPMSTFTPKHMLRVWTDYRLPQALSNWSVGAGVNMQSDSYKTNRNVTISQGGYAVWNARVAYQITPQWLLSLNVNNLTNKLYYQTLGTVSGGNYYGDPRNATLALRGKF